MDIRQKNRAHSQTVINNESGTVNLHQPQPSYINLSEKGTYIDYKSISEAKHNNFLLLFISSVIIPLISFMADLMGLMPILDLPSWVYLVIAALMFFVLTLTSYDNFSIMTSNFHAHTKRAHLYADRLCTFYEGQYVIHTYEAPCTYPGCSGNIEITNPPEKSNGSIAYFGECSVAGKEHSYGIDINLVASPKEIDWSKIDPNN